MNLKEFEWKWQYYNKSHWIKMYVVDIDGVFVKKTLECDTFKPDPVHENIFWFSHVIGTLAGVGHMYFKTDSWCVEEKESNWIVHNKDKTVWNSSFSNGCSTYKNCSGCKKSSLVMSIIGTHISHILKEDNLSKAGKNCGNNN